MTDIDEKQRQILTAFGVYQMRTNPGGIGNECTHWIYAALFEARALEHDRDLHIDQGQRPLTWGRPVQAAAARIGDITQFQDFRTNYFVYRPDTVGQPLWTHGHKTRRPDHTGMIIIKPPKSGTFFELESHLHQQGKAVMSIRHNQIFYDSFSIAISTSNYDRVKRRGVFWPANIDPLNDDELLNRVFWDELRDDFEITAKEAHEFIRMINHHQTPKLGGKEMAVVFQVQSTGHLKFYRPQKSDHRLRMSADQLAKEKSELIKRMITGAREGHEKTEDAFGGDNKQQRSEDHRFDWNFPAERPGSTPPPIEITITPSR
jgi:hypothetical protein